MSQIDRGLFKKYDIRGKALGIKVPLTRDAAYAIGRSIGTLFVRHYQMDRVVSGRDNRLSSYDLQSALIEGLQESGLHVIDIGMVSTPVVYWHAMNQGGIGGVMVTGSHLAHDYNGFKLCMAERPLFGDDITMIYEYINNADFELGEGSYQQHSNPIAQYISDIYERINVTGQFNVVFDPGNGTGGIFAPRLLEMWGQTVVGINVEPDGLYPNHQPDPQKESNMLELGAKVRELGADFGLGYDGDADRVGVVDENGQLIAADRILALLAQDMLMRHPNAVIVGDVLSSQTLFDAVEQAGGVPQMAASGHSLVKDAMREAGSFLGGEMSGHMFFGEDYYGFDDAYFATGRILQMLTHANRPLSELNNALPFYFSTPEYRPHCPDNDKSTVIEGVRRAVADKGTRTVTVDGVRVQFEKGWGIIRASNTEPVLSLRFEGETEADAIQYRDWFFEALAQFPQVEKL